MSKDNAAIAAELTPEEVAELPLFSIETGWGRLTDGFSLASFLGHAVAVRVFYPVGSVETAAGFLEGAFDVRRPRDDEPYYTELYFRGMGKPRIIEWDSVSHVIGEVANES